MFCPQTESSTLESKRVFYFSVLVFEVQKKWVQESIKKGTEYVLSADDSFLLFSGNKLKEGWSKFVDKMKSKKAKKKKMKKMEQELVMRIMNIQGDVSNEDDVSSREGSVYSQQDSDRVSLRLEAR